VEVEDESIPGLKHLHQDSIIINALLLLSSSCVNPNSMQAAPFPGPLIPASIRVEADTLSFPRVVFELAYVHTSVELRLVIAEVNAEPVSIVVAPLAVVGVSILIFHPSQALLLVV
jgi:hypothetical protein